MSEDEFDQLPDIFFGVDWSTVPELSDVPPASHHGTWTSNSVLELVGPRASTTPSANGRDSSSESTQNSLDKYNDSFDEWDASFLDDLSKVEQRVFQLPQLAEGLLLEDRGEGTSSNGEEFLSISSTTDVVPHIFKGTVLQVAQDISSPHEGVKGTGSHAEESVDVCFCTDFRIRARVNESASGKPNTLAFLDHHRRTVPQRVR